MGAPKPPGPPDQIHYPEILPHAVVAPDRVSYEEPSIAELIAARPAFAHACDGWPAIRGYAAGANRAAAHGTPTWVYGAATLRGRYPPAGLVPRLPGVAIHYAVKANDHLAVLSRYWRRKAPALTWSAAANYCAPCMPDFQPDKIVFSGVGKSADELRLALNHGIGQINVESPEELDLLSQHCRGGRAVTARIALRAQSGCRCWHAHQNRHWAAMATNSAFRLTIASLNTVCARFAAHALRHRHLLASRFTSAARYLRAAPFAAMLTKSSPPLRARCGRPAIAST